VDADQDLVLAERDYREALRIAKKLGNREGVAMNAGNLAELALDSEDWPAAERLAREASRLAEAIGKQELVGSDCHLLAEALARQGRPDEGLPFAHRAVSIFTKLQKPDDLEKAEAALRELEAGLQASPPGKG
jgi:hypothetical protein